MMSNPIDLPYRKDGAHILLVDDMPENIKILGHILSRENYTFSVSEDGAGTFRAVQERKPDLILMDIMMPDMDGFEVCQRLKADPSTADIPLIFLTARIEVQDKVRAFEIGAVDYITKPFQPAEVASRVRNHLQLKAARQTISEYRDKLEKLLEERTIDLMESEEMFRSTFENASIGMAIVSPSLRVRRANPALVKILGYSEPELLSLHYLDFIEQSQKETMQNEYGSLLRGEVPSIKHGMVFVRKDGQSVFILANAAVIRDINGLPVNFIVHLQDVSEEREAFNKLENSLQQQNLLAHVAGALNSTVDFHAEIGNILDFILISLDISTILFIETPGVGAAEITVFRFAPGTHPPKDLETLTQSEDFERHIVETIRNGSQLVINQLETSSHPFSDVLSRMNVLSAGFFPIMNENTLRGMIFYGSQDESCWTEIQTNLLLTITNMVASSWERYDNYLARIEAEEKRSQAIEMLEKSARMASLGVMSAGITHEINQPLSAIKVTADSIQHWSESHPNAIPDIILESLSEISEGARKIDTIIQHMRHSWIIPEGDKLEKVELKSLVQNSLRLFQRQLISHGIRLDVESSPEPLVFQAVRIQIEQILVNLVVNAIQALDVMRSNDKHIVIQCDSFDKRVRLIVEDNGPGFPPENAERLFEPLFSTKKSGSGSGLGLAIAKTFTEKYLGQIIAENTGNGARFTVSFPQYDMNKD